MFCLDTSDNMRNGDYSPTRLEAQNETVHHMCNRKINANQESTAGFLSMGGRHVAVLATPGRDVGVFMKALRNVKCEGVSDFVSGIKTAQLALKNRQNKSQQQRIVLFAGSPIEEETKTLVTLGQQLQRNDVAVDIINFGFENSTNDNTEKLEAFIKACNKNNNSRLLNVPPGPHILSKLVQSSEIGSEGATGGSSVAAVAPSRPAQAVNVHNVNAAEDPELAAALRASMEEEKQRIGAIPSTPASSSSSSAVAASEADEDMEAELLAAIAMSLQADGGDVEMTTPPPKPTVSAAPGAPVAAATPSAPATTTTAASTTVSSDDVNDALNNPDFLSNLLGEAGVDQGDIQLDDILDSIKGKPDDKDGKDKK